MTIGPRGELIIETLGDLRDNGTDLSAYCADHRCGRRLTVNLAKLIDLFGPDTPYVHSPQLRRIVCSACGSKVDWSLTQDYDGIFGKVRG